MDHTIDAFYNFLSLRALSDATKSSYTSDLKLFLKKDMQVEPFFSFLKERGYASASISRIFFSLKIYYRFLKKRGAKDLYRFEDLDAPRVMQSIPEVLSIEQVKKLLAMDAKSYNERLVAAVLELLYSCGLRVSELCSLNLYNVDDKSVKVMGKGSKERLVPIAKRSIKVLDRYLLQRSQGGIGSALFVTQKGKRLYRQWVYHAIRERAKACGLEKRIGPHTLRHSYATHLLEGGADIRVIQELLGHASISSTDRYTHISVQKIQQDFNKIHPRSSIS